MAKRFNWRTFFTYPNGQRLETGHSEEQRYQAFKARFLEEQRQERERVAARAVREHEQILNDVYGPHGQG